MHSPAKVVHDTTNTHMATRIHLLHQFRFDLLLLIYQCPLLCHYPLGIKCCKFLLATEFRGSSPTSHFNPQTMTGTNSQTNKPPMQKLFWVLTLALVIILATVFKLPIPLPSSLLKPSDPKPVNPRVPFPDWLKDLTGLKEWPHMDPPYIPLSFIDFSKIEHAPIHVDGNCREIIGDVCSFDCSRCVSPDDVYSCPLLSQTFDDGPTAATPLLLAELNSPTSFFVLGYNVVRFPDTYLAAVNQKHVMGCHTWSHLFLPSLTNEQIIAQIEWGIFAMNATGNHLPKWFRPPYGGVDNRVRSIVRQFGMRSVLWDLDTTDWKINSKMDTKEHVLSETKRNINGRTLGLILEHDLTPDTVLVAIEVRKLLPNQMTVPQCAGGEDYLKVFA